MSEQSLTQEPAPSVEDQLAQLEHIVTHLQVENARQQDVIARLRAAAAGTLPSLPNLLPVPVTLPSAPALDAAEDSAATAKGRRSRRALLKLGGAATAAGMAAVAASATELAHPGAAHAAGPGSFDSNVAGTPAVTAAGTNGAIGLTGSSDSSVGVYGASTSFYGVWGSSSSNIGVLGTSTNSTGVHGKTDGALGVPAVHGIATQQGIGVLGEATIGPGVKGTSTNIGVRGSSDGGYGVYGTSGSGGGVWGNSNSGVGGYFSGGRAALTLISTTNFPGPPTGGQYGGGELYVDVQNVLWYCFAVDSSGSGIWRRLCGPQAGTPGGALNYLAAPIRIFDTRSGQPAPLPASKGALAGGSTTTIQVTGTSVGGLSVPAGASGVVGNLTVTNTQGGGDLILYPHGAAQPLTSNINYSGGQTIANFASVALSSGGAMDLYVHVSGTDVIFDVAGYVF